MRALALVALIHCASFAEGQSGSPTPIAADRDVSDQAIERRLDAIYAEIEEWRGIETTVSQGIVTLRGEALESAAAEQAVSLAERLDGVVLVRDQITIPRDLESRLAPAAARARERLYDLIVLIPLIVVALVVVLIFFWLSRIVTRRAWLDRRLSSNSFLADITRQAIRVAVMLVGVVLALDLLDATALVGAVLGTAGVFGLALGFAFRDIVENYVASVLLSLRRPFAPNDHVVVDGREGRVVRLTPRATILLTLDGNHLRIPNAAVFKSAILNYTTNPLRRFELAVGVGTEEEIPQARRIGVESMEQLHGVLDSPSPSSIVENLGDSSVVLRFFGWVDQTAFDFGKVRSAALIAVKTALDEAGIEMPEPTFRVRTEPTAGEPRAESAPSTPSTPSIDEEPDISTDSVIDRQVEKERSSGVQDLLTQDAPPE